MRDHEVICSTFADDVVPNLAHVARTGAEGVFQAVRSEWITSHQVAVRVAESLGQGRRRHAR